MMKKTYTDVTVIHPDRQIERYIVRLPSDSIYQLPSEKITDSGLKTRPPEKMNDSIAENVNT